MYCTCIYVPQCRLGRIGDAEESTCIMYSACMYLLLTFVNVVLEGLGMLKRANVSCIVLVCMYYNVILEGLGMFKITHICIYSSPMSMLSWKNWGC